MSALVWSEVHSKSAVVDTDSNVKPTHLVGDELYKGIRARTGQFRRKLKDVDVAPFQMRKRAEAAHSEAAWIQPQTPHQTSTNLKIQVWATLGDRSPVLMRPCN